MNKNIGTPKQVATLALETAIRKRDWARFPNLLPAAKKYGCLRPLKHKGWIMLGDHSVEQKDFVAAILAFNSARVIALTDKKTVERLLQGLNDFYRRFMEHFSYEDLVVLKDALDRFIGFYRVSAGYSVV